MGVSIVLALVGIGLAAFLFLRKPAAADAMAAQPLRRCHRTLLEQVLRGRALRRRRSSSRSSAARDRVLWKGSTPRVIDGAVNGVGHVVAQARRARSACCRPARCACYAASLFLGVRARFSATTSGR